ncbi:hypothetical protein ig2599ANME_0885 [groundwater metagenome]
MIIMITMIYSDIFIPLSEPATSYGLLFCC